MEAIVLVGGQGTRLRPLTLSTPKPMLPAAGAPILAHQLAKLADAGVDHVVLATSYRAEVFAAYFGDGGSLGVRLDYVTETEPLGTAGAIRNVSDALDSSADAPIIILNGDVLSGHDMREQLALHCDNDAAVTLHLVRVDDARAFGSVPTDDGGRVTAFVEKSPDPVSDQINAGCYVFRRSVIDDIPAGQVVSVERVTFPGLLATGATVMGYVDSSYWLDVGTPASFVQASADLVRGVAASPLVAKPAPSWLAPDAQLDPSASVTGGSSVLGRAAVGPDATVEASVVMSGARIECGATVVRSVVGAGARIGADTVVEDAVIGDDARIGARNELLRGVRVWPGVDLPDAGVRFSSDV